MHGLTREVNLEIADKATENAEDPPSFYCECGRIGCTELISAVSVEKFNSVTEAANALRVVRGHEMDELDEVIEDFGGFVIVERF